MNWLCGCLIVSQEAVNKKCGKRIAMNFIEPSEFQSIVNSTHTDDKDKTKDEQEKKTEADDDNNDSDKDEDDEDSDIDVDNTGNNTGATSPQTEYRKMNFAGKKAKIPNKQEIAEMKEEYMKYWKETEALRLEAKKRMQEINKKYQEWKRKWNVSSRSRAKKGRSKININSYNQNNVLESYNEQINKTIHNQNTNNSNNANKTVAEIGNAGRWEGKFDHTEIKADNMQASTLSIDIFKNENQMKDTIDKNPDKPKDKPKDKNKEQRDENDDDSELINNFLND